MTQLLNILAIVASLVSAGLWFWSAKLPPVYPMAYLDGPPPKVRALLHKQARLNAWAAGFTGLAVLLQAIGLALTTWSSAA